ncbi:protein TolQ [Caulobacter segnis]|uniref:Protein TolQ n=1 Tax=Caulobacter segnis TaxID=88688 RepID=A0A2W5V881_9CAUL|nr:protein TolQ [Caulobacter segnis]PZR35980.1 MAG: protein TolQ [Caulobacter segnis]
MDASAAAPNFSFFALFMQADWVVKGVMIGLILASLGSWAVIIDKLYRFTTLNRAADRFEEQVGGGRSLEDVAGEAGANPAHALPRMLQAALKEWREAKTRAMTENQTGFLIARIDRILDTIIARETAKVEEGLGSLAIVATASPFIGLFGTVWGIMHAFQNIALSKNTSLAVVAPSIAEALFATAVGLIAAIPAYIAYNKFSTDAGKYAGRLEGFADDLSTAIQRRLTER